MSISVIASGNAAGTTGSATTSAANTVGANCIVVTGSYASAATLTDSLGNTWTQLAVQVSGSYVLKMWYCLNPITGSAHTFTLAGSNSFPNISFVAASGVASVFAQNPVAGATVAGSSVTSLQPTSQTPPVNGALLVTGATFGSGTAAAINSGFTALTTSFNPGITIGGGIGYLVQAAAAPIDPTWSWTTASNAAVAMAYFLPNVPVTNAAILWSPGNWYSNGSGSFQPNNVLPSSTYALSNTPGAYFRTVINSTGSGLIAVTIDTTILTGITAGSTPVIAYSIDTNAWTTVQLTASSAPTTINLVTGLSAGAHTLELYFMAVDLTSTTSMGDRWNNPVTNFSGVKILYFTIDTGSTLSAPVTRPYRAIWFGDSTLEAAENVSSALTVGGQDAGQGYGYVSMLGLNAEIGLVGNASQGYAHTGSGNFPALYNAPQSSSSWPYYFSGASRLGQPLDWVICNHGINGTVTSATVQGWITQVRAAYPAVKIFVMVPWIYTNASSIVAGVAAYQAAVPSDTNVFLINPTGIPNGTAYWNAGGTFLHPNVRGDALTAAAYVGGIKAALTSGGGGGGASTGGLSSSSAATPLPAPAGRAWAEMGFDEQRKAAIGGRPEGVTDAEWATYGRESGRRGASAARVSGRASAEAQRRREEQEEEARSQAEADARTFARAQERRERARAAEASERAQLENRRRAESHGCSEAGTIAGAGIGRYVGAAAGTAILPGVGTAIGAVGGSLLGGYVGGEDWRGKGSKRG